MEVRYMRIVTGGDAVVLGERDATVARKLAGLFHGVHLSASWVRKRKKKKKALLVTSHDEESLIGHPGLLKNVQNVLKPLVRETDGVEISVQLALTSEPVGTG